MDSPFSMSNRPNILWYCTDQQRFDTIGALGNPYVRTPTIDRLTREGVAFTHTYCQSPICTPSRASFMTGLYPSRLHNTRNGNEAFPTEAPPLITKLIADSGYFCGLIGKLHLVSAGLRPEPRLEDGFGVWQHSHAPRDDWPEGTHDYGDWVREQGGDLDAMRESEERVAPELHQTKWASDRAIEFIGREHDRPWLLNINVYDPHPPFIPPKSYADKFDPDTMPGPHVEPGDLETQRLLSGVAFQGEAGELSDEEAREVQAKYYAMIAQIDDQFARVLEALDATGQRDNTVIIFTSDHGEMLGDHGLLKKGCRFYEGLVRVPLIISWPGSFPGGRQCADLVELLDLSATLLDLAEVSVPEYHQGRSLLPVLEGNEVAGTAREAVRCEYFDALDEQFTGGGAGYATMHRDERYKLCVYHDAGLGELYDLEEDPWEHRNLWADPGHREVRERLVFESFNRHVVLTTDVGSRRIAGM